MVPITRRHALVGLTLGVALIPFRVDAQQAFAVLANAIGEAITQSVKVISAVTEQLDQAVTNGISTYNKVKLQRLRSVLEGIEGQMASLNGRKRYNIQAFRDYINRDPLADSWMALQKYCADISMNLDALLSHLEADDTELVKGTGFATAGDLKAALLRQASIYLRLSTLSEPTTPADRALLAGIVDKLDVLLKHVIGLESSIEKYLSKFRT
jgi:hypothetical protein